jgi:hypothetical protein
MLIATTEHGMTRGGMIVLLHVCQKVLPFLILDVGQECLSLTISCGMECV